MWPFHKHKWELVGKIYAEPINISTSKTYSLEDSEMILEAVRGLTTFLWKCSDINCDSILKEKCIGKEII